MNIRLHSCVLIVAAIVAAMLAPAAKIKTTDPHFAQQCAAKH